jgi:hypothetical protein
MKTFLLPLLPLLAVSGAVSAQDAVLIAPPAGGQTIILIADPQEPTPKPKASPDLPLQYRIVPQPGSEPQRPLLAQPRFTMPVIQHDLSQYPMPTTLGKGHPVQIPVAPPKLPPAQR